MLGRSSYIPGPPGRIAPYIPSSSVMIVDLGHFGPEIGPLSTKIKDHVTPRALCRTLPTKRRLRDDSGYATIRATPRSGLRDDPGYATIRATRRSGLRHDPGYATGWGRAVAAMARKA